MKYKVFVDTNVLLSGIFFEGNESSVLDLVELDIITKMRMPSLNYGGW